MSLRLFYHFIELKFRIIYIFISFLLTFIICFNYWKVIFWYFTLLFLASHKFFIYTKIYEALFISIKFSLFISLIINLIFIIYNSFFYLIKGFYNIYIYLLCIYIFFFYLLLIIIFFISYDYLIPYILNFLLNFQQLDINLFSILTFEARLSDFFNLICNVIYIFYLNLFIFFSFISFLILKYNFKFLRPLTYLLLIFIILIFSPPDLFIQIILFFIFLIIVEIIIFLNYCIKFFWWE